MLAGEVLEAHILSSLTSSVKHVIMIGDHKQLRPKVETHALTISAQQGHNLNLSLFERLIVEGLGHKTLQLQHRMRPEIAAIARHMTYPELRNHPAVETRGALRGLAANVVFVNHTHHEEEVNEDDEVSCMSFSKVNKYEAQMTVQIVQFLLLQGYSPDQIVVLVPYLGQLKILSDLLQSHDMAAGIGDRDEEDLLSLKIDQPWQRMSSSAQGIRVSTIDNYQGEEADIVVASLVRSNPKGHIGFLGKADAEQRVNVLCTSARLGLIFIGNVECFKNASPPSPLWCKLLQFLQQSGSIFDGLPIKCQQHKSLCEPADVCEPQQLAKWCKEGAGCGRQCDTLLDCGHVCPLRCHPWAHDTVKCARAVRQMCPAKLHRIEVACSSKEHAYCCETVIDNCQMEHPVVRQCGQVFQTCEVCDVLKNAASTQSKDEAARINTESKLFVRYIARVAANDKPEVELREEMAAELTNLTKKFEEERRQSERLFGVKLDRVTMEAQEAVAAAINALANKHQEDQRRLQARRADTEQNLLRVATRLEKQRADARQALVDHKQNEDQALHQLHEALVAGLKAVDQNIKEAYEGRPDPECIQQQLNDLRHKVTAVSCAICIDDLTILDGALCRADGHFVCNDCLTNHVKAETDKPDFDGNIYCPYRSPAMGGCQSSAYLGCVIARHTSQEAFQALEQGRLALREKLNSEKMQRGFDELLEIEKRKWAEMSRYVCLYIYIMVSSWRWRWKLFKSRAISSKAHRNTETVNLNFPAAPSVESETP